MTYKGWLSVPAMYAALNDPVHPYLLTGGNTAEQNALVYPTVNNTIWNSLSFVQATASKDLMKMDGGPLSVAFGAGDVYRNLNSPNPGVGQYGHRQHSRSHNLCCRQPEQRLCVRGVAIPVLKTLEIDAALRYDYYNKPNNDAWTPKIGAKWTPMKEFALRGTAGTGFRAPYMTESGNAGAAFNLGNMRDPLNCPVQPAQRSAGSFGYVEECAGDLHLQPRVPAISNPNLKPEKSENFTAGFILEPIKGWETTFDWYYIKLKNQIINVANTPTYDPLNYLVRNPQTQLRAVL